MTIEEAVKFAVHAKHMTDIQEVKEFYALAEAALREKADRENPEPLTLDELRQMYAPVWCLCKPIEGGNGYWCICQKGTIITPAWFSYDVEEIPNWVFLRSKPKEDAVCRT